MTPTMSLTSGAVQEAAPRERYQDKTDVRLSVFDLPEEVTLLEDSTPGLIDVVFRYPDAEEMVVETLEGGQALGVSVGRGKYSGKIMQLKWSQGRDRIGGVAEALLQAADRRPRLNERLSYLLAANVLKVFRDGLPKG